MIDGPIIDRCRPYVACVYASEAGHRAILDPIRDMLSLDRRFRVVDLSDARGTASPHRVGSSLLMNVKHAVRPWLLTPILRRHLARFEARLRAERADLAILAEDNVASPTRLMVAAAKRAGARVMIAPFTIPNPREAANAVRGRRGHRVRLPWRRRFAAAYPHWVRQDDDATQLRMPMLEAMQMERLGLGLPAPWIVNRGAADAIAVESEVMAKVYRKLGFPGNQLAITGSPSDDVLAAALANRTARKADLAAETGIDPARPLLVFAFPPDQFAANLTPDAPFTTFAEMKRFFSDALVDVSRTFSVVIKPHPRLDPRKLEPLPLPLAVSRRETAELVAICDLYVATGSATSRWAIAAGKPVLEYDVFRYRLGDYAGIQGTAVAVDPDDFLNKLQRAAGDSAWLRQMARAQAKVAVEWGRLDGQSGERIKALAWRLASRS